MSSLKTQLKAIAGAKPVGKSRVTLIYDNADDIGRDVIYAVGKEALDDLIAIDGSLAQFEHSLFSASLKDQDRMLLVFKILFELELIDSSNATVVLIG